MRRPTLATAVAVALLALLPACGEGGGVGGGADGPADAAGGADAPPADGEADADAAPDDAGPGADAADVAADGADPGPPLLTRPEAGEPVTDEELLAVTDRYLELMRVTRWLDVVDERVHGWPASDPEGRYWYGTWWSGVSVLKEGGAVTYRHGADGADNNGLRTGPILAGVCFADHLVGGRADLVRRLVRGFTSWILAMERDPDQGTGVLLSRAAYPASVTSTDGGRTIHIDYGLNRPGEDNGATRYVHNPDNPWWGDLWVKNRRSKDDIGHMLQALAHLVACAGPAGEGLDADVADLIARYEAWARRVEDDGWVIATVDADWQLQWPNESLAVYSDLGGAECAGMLALRLLGRGDAGALQCGEGQRGLNPLDEVPGFKNDVYQILRSHHQAAALLAQLRGDRALAASLLSGLAWRLDAVMASVEVGTPSPLGPDKDLAELLLMSAAAGVPLTWREVRYLHARLDEAHASFLAGGLDPSFRVFDPATPDGTYAFTPEAQGLHWRHLGAVLGTCASAYRNPTSKPVLSCARVEAVGLGGD